MCNIGTGLSSTIGCCGFNGSTRMSVPFVREFLSCFFRHRVTHRHGLHAPQTPCPFIGGVTACRQSAAGGRKRGPVIPGYSAAALAWLRLRFLSVARKSERADSHMDPESSFELLQRRQGRRFDRPRPAVGSLSRAAPEMGPRASATLGARRRRYGGSRPGCDRAHASAPFAFRRQCRRRPSPLSAHRGDEPHPR